MINEALKLADELDALHQYVPSEAPAMIRRLVEELDRLNYDLKSLAKRYKALDITKPTITKLDGKVVAVTMTDDEHRVTEVLWEAQKQLSDDEIKKVWNEMSCVKIDDWQYQFAKAIEERHGIK